MLVVHFFGSTICVYELEVLITVVSACLLK